MKKVALFLFLSVCFAQQSCSSDSVGTEPEENPQDILFKDDFNFSTKKYGRKKLMNPAGPIKSYRHTMPLMCRLEKTGINRF